ncbi:MAG: maleylacetate reductase [Shimia sp.]|nr:maleylacetate reductase [Shimia sp.]
MDPFTAHLNQVHVRFGTGMDGVVGEEIKRLGLTKVLMLSTPQQAEDAAKLAKVLGEVCCGIFSQATMHTPVDVTNAAISQIVRLNADGLVSFGGGSTTGLGKAIALRTGLPQIAVPTTYAGSEATPILGQTEAGKKTTLRDAAVLPSIIVYDVARTATLPLQMTMTSGLNALAHAVAALQAQDASPISDMMAQAGIDAMIPALRRLRTDLEDPTGRSDALFAAWMCGTVLGQVTMSLHHKLCHVLGGTFDLPHSETHSIMLAHAAAFNSPAVTSRFDPLRDALKDDDVGSGLAALAADLGVPTALRDLGMPEAGIDRAADLAMDAAYWNPRPLDRGAIRDLIARAWAGEPPE